MTSKNTDILIEQIKIVIQNPIIIPGSSEETVITKDILYHPSIENIASRLNKYPYITKDVKIPSKKLYKLANRGSDGYALIVEFFFNKEMFKQRLYKYVGDDTLIQKEQKNNSKSSSNDNLMSNLELMLKLLLPTTFPQKSNYFTSFDRFIKQRNMQSLSIQDRMLYSLSIDDRKTLGFSYLKLNNKVYTITAVTWLNDIFNNPVYRNFINNYIDYTSWATITSQNIRQNILIILQSIINRIYDDHSSTQSLYIFNNIDKLKDALKKSETITSSSRIVVSGEGSTEMFKNNLSNMINLIEEIRGSETDYKQYITCYNDENNKKQLIDDDNAYSTFISTEYITECDIKSPSTFIQELFTKIDNIYEYYSKISKFTIPGLVNFDDRIKKIYREIKDISLLNTIHKFYVNTENVSMFDLETKDTQELEIKTKLEKSYEQYINFITSIKTLLKPVRDCNTPLQDIIYKFSKNISIVDEDALKFNDIMKYIKYRMIYLDDSVLDFIPGNEDRYKDILKLNVISLDKSKVDNPHYEAYIDVDLVEAQLDNSNKDDFKCIYYDMQLGRDLNNMINRTKIFSVTKYNPYTIESQHITITAEDIKKKKGSNDNIPPIPPQSLSDKAKKTKGGYTCNKYRRRLNYHKRTRKQ